MSQTNSRRQPARRQDTPQRVASAAEQMRNTSPHGSLRGFVPQQTGSQQPIAHAVPQGRNGTPYMSSTMNGTQRGFVNNTVPPPKKKKGFMKAFLIILGVIMALGGIAYATMEGIRLSREAEERRILSEKVTPYDNLYCNGVYVDGIHLGGMSPEQAMNSVQSQISQRHDAWKVQLVYQGSVLADITTDTLSMSVDQNELINVMNEAWTHGHTGSHAERAAEMDQLAQTPYYAYTAKPSGNTGEINRILNAIKNRIERPAQDAYLQAFEPSNSYPFIFAEEVTGLTLDTEPLIEQLYQMVSTMTSGVVQIIPEEIAPQVTLAELQTHYQLRATATTPIDRHSTEDRNNNIRRCFELISGYTLDPGKTFSFNTVVGERSTQNGFFPAIEYINDEHVEGIGGGACQASTTLYQAAVEAGMQIVSRRPHSDSVSYSDYGKDATVYWMRGGSQIDMCFKNTTDYPVYLVASVVKDRGNKNRLVAKASIYGEDLGNVSYKLVAELVETLPSIMDPVYVKDKDSAAKAKDGCIVNSYRITYVDGAETAKEFLFKDTYKPKPEKIYDPSKAD